MTQINLLPWREQLREERNRQYFFILGGGALASLLLMLVVHMTAAGFINHQLSRNTYLQREIVQLNQQIREIKDLKRQKVTLIARMQVIQELQANRSQVVHFFDEVVEMLPEGVFLTRIERVGDKINVEGIAESNTNVSKLMRNIDSSHWLAQPGLNEIKTDEVEGRNVNEFKLQMTLVHPPMPETQIVKDEVDDVNT